MSNKIDSVNGTRFNKNILLLILDGWGLSSSWSGNAISYANPINFNKLWRSYPHVSLKALNNIENTNRVGNSEVGHASIGCGRMVKQDLEELNNAIDNGVFYQNKQLIEVCSHVNRFKSKLNLIGMISNGSIHSNTKHLFALLELAKKKKVKNINIHLITDGIDDNIKAIDYITKLKKYINNNQNIKISTIVGRLYAMDKSGNQKLIEKTYLLQTKGIGNKTNDCKQVLEYYYDQGFTDYNIPPTYFKGGGLIEQYDGVIFFNFRADRAQNLTRAYVDEKYFSNIIGRKYKILKDLYFVTLTSYLLKKEKNLHVAFKSTCLKNCLSEILSRNKIKQLKISEHEKKIHLNYFFNGGTSKIFENEKQIIIDSKKREDYINFPEMSAQKIYLAIKKALNDNKYNLIVANFANIDTIAHTGDIQATKKAVKCIDKIIGKIVKDNAEGVTIITADHGNAENLVPNLYVRETMHTANPVPFIIVKKGKQKNYMDFALESSHVQMNDLVDNKYTIADIAPTILELFNIDKPKQVTGKSLLKKIGYDK